jgi:hypothetical protein
MSLHVTTVRICAPVRLWGATQLVKLKFQKKLANVKSRR